MEEQLNLRTTEDLRATYYRTDDNIRHLLNDICEFARKGEATDVAIIGDSLTTCLNRLHAASQILSNRGYDFVWSEYDINCRFDNNDCEDSTPDWW